MKLGLCLVSLLLFSGCAQLSEVYVETVHKMGLTPAYDKERMDQHMAAKAARAAPPPIVYPRASVPEGTPDGPFVIYFANGQPRLKTVANKGYMDEYVDVYYENGQLRTHTPIRLGWAHGLSKGYLPNGQLQSTIMLQEGKAEGWVLGFDAKGQAHSRIRYRAGQPQRDWDDTGADHDVQP